MKHKYILFFVFLLVLAVRLSSVFSTPYFDFETYDTFRQVENILDTGYPLFYDELSHGGRERVFSPVYSYVLAFFGLFMPIELVFKIIPNLFGALSVFMVFSLTKQITKSEKISLLFAALSGFIPAFFLGTVNNASILNLAVPAFLVTIYYFLLTNTDARYVYKLIFSLIFLTLLHPVSIILSISLIVYLLFLKIKNFRESNREPEVVLFFSFLVFWLNLVVYKTALLSHESPLIWKNIPSELLLSTYSQISFLEAIYGIGSVFLIFGLLSVYFNLFEAKRKTVTLFMSLAIVFSSFIFFKFIEVFEGLIFLGIILCILASYSFIKVYNLIDNFKYDFATALFVIVIIFIQLVLFLPSFDSARSGHLTPTELDVKAAKYMSNFDDAKILSQYYEGHFISYYSNQKNVIDSDFLLVPNVDKFYLDASGVYKDRFITGALGRLTRLEATHVFLSENYQKRTDTEKLLVFDNECITLIYPDDEDYKYHPKIYEVRCLLNE